MHPFPRSAAGKGKGRKSSISRRGVFTGTQWTAASPKPRRDEVEAQHRDEVRRLPGTEAEMIRCTDRQGLRVPGARLVDRTVVRTRGVGFLLSDVSSACCTQLTLLSFKHAECSVYAGVLRLFGGIPVWQKVTWATTRASRLSYAESSLADHHEAERIPGS